MSPASTRKTESVSEKRSVQEYIDETPFWRDGTEVAFAPMTGMQWRIWGLASAGKFFEGLVIFMTGVALPLIAEEFSLSATDKGLVGAAALFGILIGSSVLGGLADTFGRKRIFVIEMVLFVLFLIGLSIAANFTWVILCLFGIGIALGGDYPTAHMVISESIPSRDRGKLVLSAFGFQALGALVGTGIGYLILYETPELGAWRWMYATAVIPGVLVLIGRLFITDSAQWLVSQGRIEEAEREARRLLTREPAYPKEIHLDGTRTVGENAGPTPVGGYGELFSARNRRATLFASIPWFLQDLGTYGIGIFTPTILAATIGAKTEARNVADLVHNEMLAAKGAAFLDLLLIVGILFAVLLADKVGRVKLQILGFIGCAVGLFVAAISQHFDGSTQMMLIFTGFMLFNFMTNMGPNAQTYLLAGEVFPTAVRGKGAGLAASFAKSGAVMTAFLFPVLLKDIGTTALLYILVTTSLVGVAITWLFRIETRGLNLETLEH
jgi:MFS family permease